MAETSATIKDASTQALIPVDGVAVTVTPNVLAAGQSIRQGVAIGSGDGVVNQFAVVDANNRLAVYQKDYTITGFTVAVATAAVAAGPWTTNGLGRAVFTSTMTGGTVQVQGSIDGTVWINLQGYNPSLGAWDFLDYSAGAIIGSGFGLASTVVDCAGFQQIRLNCTTTSTSTPNTASVAFSSVPVQMSNMSTMLGGNGRSPSVIGPGSNPSLLITVQDTNGRLATIIKNSLLVDSDSTYATYSACYTGLVGVSGVNAVLQGILTQPNTKLRKIIISGYATTASSVDISLVKYSSPTTFGTAVTAAASVSSYTGDPAASSNTIAFSVAPTPGTVIGTIRTWTQQFLLSGSPNQPVILDFSDSHDKGPILSNSQYLGLVFSAALSGGHVNVTFVWSESGNPIFQ